MTCQEKAQELVRKHLDYAYVDTEPYGGEPYEETRKENAIEAALITARECVSLVMFEPLQSWWHEVIDELEKMKA